MFVINLCLQKKLTVVILCMNSHKGKVVGFKVLYHIVSNDFTIE